MPDPRDSPAADATIRAEAALWFEPIIVAPAEEAAPEDRPLPFVPREIPLSPPRHLDDLPAATRARDRNEVRWQAIKWVEPLSQAMPARGEADLAIVEYEPIPAAGPIREAAAPIPAATPIQEVAAPVPAAAPIQEAIEPDGAGPGGTLQAAFPTDRAPQGSPAARSFAASLIAEASLAAARQGDVGLGRRGRLIAGLIGVAVLAGGAGFAIDRIAGGFGAGPRAGARVHTAAPALPERAPAPALTPRQRAAYIRARAQSGDPTAQHDLAVLYAKGEGLGRDYAQAALWFRRAALAGVADAQYDLGVLYASGLGVALSEEDAVLWYRRAADRDNPAAQYNLGVAYATGRGIPQDFVQAAGWYQRAAEQGVVPAMVNFAILYERGEGVETSPTDAYGWYRAAADRGDTVSRQRAAVLFAGFSAAEKASARAAAVRVAASIHGPVSLPALPVGSDRGPAPVLKPGGLR